jgi:hypothetical protein
VKFVSTLLKQHLQRYPQMELADIYKLLHQAATGAAHAAPNRMGSAAHAAPNRMGSAAHAAPTRFAGAAHAAPNAPASAEDASPANAIDAAAVHAALQHEMEAMGSGPDEPMVDPISPDGKLARVHLRAYAAAGRRVEALADAFVATVQQPPDGHDKLVRFCGCLGDFADSGEIAFDAASVRAYFEKVAAERYPAVHHSTAYRSAYRPAYRIVRIDFLEL